MEKYIIVFSKNLNYCIYRVNVVQITDRGEIFLAVDPASRYENYNSWFSLPNKLRRSHFSSSPDRMKPEDAFDTREEAQSAAQKRVYNETMRAIAAKQAMIDSLQKDIEKFKGANPKGRYRNLNAVKVKP